MKCGILGIPMQTGTQTPGCVMGPDAFRCAGLADHLAQLGHGVQDFGNVTPAHWPERSHSNPALHRLTETCAWIDAISRAATPVFEQTDCPIFLGGDHALSAGTVAAAAGYAAQKRQPQFVLWLDAHPDLHRLDTTVSGNLHGTPLAYLMGEPGFDGFFPDLDHTIDPAHVALFGIRSVDPAERSLIGDRDLAAFDMRSIDEHGIARPLRSFLDRVAQANGRLHVSFDVDFLEPAIACAVGTTVPGGATFREAHLVMEMLFESGLVTSLDMVELNPFLDDRGKTARLMVDFCGSLFGRRILDRPTLNI